MKQHLSARQIYNAFVAHTGVLVAARGVQCCKREERLYVANDMVLLRRMLAALEFSEAEIDGAFGLRAPAAERGEKGGG